MNRISSQRSWDQCTLIPAGAQHPALGAAFQRRIKCTVPGSIGSHSQIKMKDLDIRCRYCGYGGEDPKIGREGIGIDVIGIPRIRCSKCGCEFVVELPTLDQIKDEIEKEKNNQKRR